MPDPGNGLFLAFGQPLLFTVTLNALADEAGAPSDQSSANFLFSFAVSNATNFQLIPGATWDLQIVPEPSAAMPMAVFLAIMLAILRRRASGSEYRLREKTELLGA